MNATLRNVAFISLTAAVVSTPLLATTFSHGVAGQGGAADEPVRVQVTRPDKGQSLVVVASGSDGDAHEMKVEAKDGRVVIETDANPDRAWLGILYAAEDDGVRITSVVKGSPAEKSGLRTGDLMTHLDGEPVAKDGSRIRDRRPGERVTLTVQRGGKDVRVPVTLGSYPDRMEIDLDDDLGAFELAGDLLGGLSELAPLESLKKLHELPCLKPGDDCFGNAFAFKVGGKPRLGVMLEAMSDQLSDYFGVEPGHGLLIMDVVADTPAARAGVKAGDVLLRVGSKDIEQAGDVREGLSDVKKGESSTVEVLRRGSRMTFTVVMDSDPAESGKRSWLERHPHAGWDGAERFAWLDMSDEDRARIHEQVQRGLEQWRQGSAGAWREQAEQWREQAEQWREQSKHWQEDAAKARDKALRRMRELRLEPGEGRWMDMRAPLAPSADTDGQSRLL